MRTTFAGTLPIICVLIGSICFAEEQRSSNVTKVTCDVDPGWESFRSRLLPDERILVRQNFGYQESNFAGGKSAGEIGGLICRDHARAYYAKEIAPKTLDDPLSASGTFTVLDAGGSSAAMIGWFNQEKSQGWRTPHSLCFRIDGNGGKYWIFYEYGTQEWGTNGGGAFEGPRYQTTPTPPYKSDGTVHRWELKYDPQRADGKGLITFRCDEETWHIPMLEGHRQQGATFDRFGIWNQQTAGNHLRVYVDDLVVDGESESFDEDPGWIRDANPVEFRQRVIRPFHDLGYSATNYAGGAPGEIGGIMFRDEAPAYYADHVGPFTFDDELFASGKMVLRSAGADSGVLLGWFGDQAKKNKKTPQHLEPQSDLLGVAIEGPSRIGHFFRPAYSTSQQNYRDPTLEATPRQRPVLRPDGTVHNWSIHYDPEQADGRGKITITLDGEEHYLELEAGHRAENAFLDRFGFFDMQTGGHHVEVFVDDLRYSK